MCKSWCEAIIAVVILLFSWVNLVSAMATKWIVTIAAIILLIHSFTCKKCFTCEHEGMMFSKKRKR